MSPFALQPSTWYAMEYVFPSAQRHYSPIWARDITFLTYLRDVLTRLPTMTTADDLRPLLPALAHAVASILIGYTVVTAHPIRASQLP